jgi:hypothetical protein
MWGVNNFELKIKLKYFFYADTSVMGAVSGAGAAGTSASTFFSSFGASGSGLGGRVIFRGSKPAR